ncbi:MAG: hypothetical protein KKE50_03050 [Nanoarchaeota archaeon]|nr:hypothetical protein [Nanoarchaeota archaeon]
MAEITTATPEGALLLGFVFIILGLFFLIKPEWFIKFQIWNQKFFLGAKYIPSKRTYLFVRLFGVLWMLGAIFCFWVYFTLI